MLSPENMIMQEQFKKFYENIKLTQAQRDDAKRKYDGVCGKLHSHYYPNTTYSGDTRFLIASYGKRTHIRPARDIDVIFVDGYAFKTTPKLKYTYPISTFVDLCKRFLHPSFFSGLFSFRCFCSSCWERHSTSLLFQDLQRCSIPPRRF